MSFSYDNALSETRDRLRFLVQDTAEATHLLANEEIDFIASTEPNLYRAAAALCHALATKFARMVGYKDKQIFDPEKKSAEYRALAEDYERKAVRNTGLNITFPSQTATTSTGSERQPAFTRDLDITGADENQDSAPEQ